MLIVIIRRRVNGKALDRVWNRLAFTTLVGLTTCLEPRVVILVDIVTIDNLLAIWECIDVKYPWSIFSSFEVARSVNLLVPDTRVVHLGVERITILEEPVDAVRLDHVAVLVVNWTGGILKPCVVGLREDVGEVEAGEPCGNARCRENEGI